MLSTFHKTLISFMMTLAAGGTSNATLINRGADTLGNRLIYDTELNVTWYDYTKSAASWQDQVNWASNLSVIFDNQTFDDWRLPATVDGVYSWGYNGTTTAGYNITSSEMGYLYYTELGNLGYYDKSGNYESGWGLDETGPFEHLKTGIYWSGTEYRSPSGCAWGFRPGYGHQNVYDMSDAFYALAVRPGDVQPEPIAQVPEPGTWILLGSGLAGLAAFRIRFAQRPMI